MRPESRQVVSAHPPCRPNGQRLVLWRLSLLCTEEAEFNEIAEIFVSGGGGHSRRAVAPRRGLTLLDRTARPVQRRRRKKIFSVISLNSASSAHKIRPPNPLRRCRFVRDRPAFRVFTLSTAGLTVLTQWVGVLSRCEKDRACRGRAPWRQQRNALTEPYWHYPRQTRSKAKTQATKAPKARGSRQPGTFGGLTH
jgi:hypothetical protein